MSKSRLKQGCVINVDNSENSRHSYLIIDTNENGDIKLLQFQSLFWVEDEKPKMIFVHYTAEQKLAANLGYHILPKRLSKKQSIADLKITYVIQQAQQLMSGDENVIICRTFKKLNKTEFNEIIEAKMQYDLCCDLTTRSKFDSAKSPKALKETRYFSYENQKITRIKK